MWALVQQTPVSGIVLKVYLFNNLRDCAKAAAQLEAELELEGEVVTAREVQTCSATPVGEFANAENLAAHRNGG